MRPKPASRPLHALRRAAAWSLAALVACAWSTVSAQDAKLPPEEEVALETKPDRVQLKASYFPPAKKDQRETVPILLLHAFKGNRGDFRDLALALQAAGHAVLVPDLRGHGDSTTQLVGDKKERLDPTKFSRDDFVAMGRDVEACKSFLREQHDQERLNIDRLVIVGAEMGAIVGLNWAAYDWSRPPLVGIGKKQGQWVKAMVLLSPVNAVKGYAVQEALKSRDVQKEIAMYILHGKRSKDAAKIAGLFERYRPPPPPPAAGEQPEERNLVVGKLDTTLEGTKLLTLPELEVAARIAHFVDVFVAKKSEYEWKDWSIR